MELLGKNPSMQDLIEKLNEVVGNLNNSMPTTDSEIAEVKKLVSFGSDVLAGRLNSKLWYFKTQELMTASTELCEGDSCFVLNDGASTGDGTFEYWYVYKTDTVVDIVDSYVSLYNPDLVAVKLQDMTLKDIKERLSLLTDQSTEIANLGSRITNLKSDTEASLRGKADLVNGLVPSNQLPSYVDDIIEGWLEDVEFPENVYAKEDANMTTPLEPESGKIYVNLLNNLQYRWGGSFFVEVSKSLAIGETSTTAFAGDRGAKLEKLAKIPNLYPELNFKNGSFYHFTADEYGTTTNGMCIAENYLIVTRFTANDSPSTYVIIDLNTKEEVAHFEFNTLHSNSLTYNPNTKEVICASTGHLYVFDFNVTDITLTLKSDTEITSCSAICYVPERDSYYLRRTNNQEIYETKDFEELSLIFTVEALTSSEVTQGMGCDGNFIFVCYSSSTVNYIYVYTLEGNLVNIFSFSAIAFDELEEVDFFDGAMIVSTTKNQYYSDLYAIRYSLEFKQNNLSSGNSLIEYSLASRTIYVDSTADNNGVGTQSSPFKTIEQALRLANFRGENCYINLSGEFKGFSCVGLNKSNIVFTGNATFTSMVTLEKLGNVVFKGNFTFNSGSEWNYSLYARYLNLSFSTESDCAFVFNGGLYCRSTLISGGNMTVNASSLSQTIGIEGGHCQIFANIAFSSEITIKYSGVCMMVFNPSESFSDKLFNTAYESGRFYPRMWVETIAVPLSIGLNELLLSDYLSDCVNPSKIQQLFITPRSNSKIICSWRKGDLKLFINSEIESTNCSFDLLLILQ